MVKKHPNNLRPFNFADCFPPVKNIKLSLICRERLFAFGLSVWSPKSVLSLRRDWFQQVSCSYRTIDKLLPSYQKYQYVVTYRRIHTALNVIGRPHVQIWCFKCKNQTSTWCDPRFTELTVAPSAASLSAANTIIRITSFLRSGWTESLCTATHSLRSCAGRREVQLNHPGCCGVWPSNMRSVTLEDGFVFIPSQQCHECYKASELRGIA